jgi:molecular chaperone GrpE
MTKTKAGGDAAKGRQKKDKAAEAAAQTESEQKHAAEIEALKGENEELSNRMLRLRADFENFRKRTVKERADIARRSNENLLSDLIPVLDHFEMGLDMARQNEIPAAVLDGFKLVYEQLLQAVQKAGVVRIEAEGEVFNPHQHECISHLPSDDVPEGVVSAQTRCGYRIDNYILRAAQVVVSSGPAPAAAQDEETQEQGEE